MRYLPLCFVGLFAVSCGPDWGDCDTCKPGEDSVESVGGDKQVPVSVNVQVDVEVVNDTDVNVSDQTDVTITAPPAQPPIVVPQPPKCRSVCDRYRFVRHCDNGRHLGNCKKNCWGKRKCVKETRQCF